MITKHTLHARESYYGKNLDDIVNHKNMEDIERFKRALHKNDFKLSDALHGKGYIYFVTDGEYVKIGKAMNPCARIMDLQIANARELTILALIPFCAYDSDITTVEKAFHRYFSDKHIRGEWFNVLDEIKSSETLKAFKLSKGDKIKLWRNGSRYKAYGKRWYENTKSI